MNEQKRWVMFFLIVGATLLVFNFFFKPPPPPIEPNPVQQTAELPNQPSSSSPDAGGQPAIDTPANADQPIADNAAGQGETTSSEALPDSGEQPQAQDKAVIGSKPSKMLLKASWGDVEFSNQGATLSSVVLFDVDPPAEPKGERQDRQLISPLLEKLTFPLDVPGPNDSTMQRSPLPLNLVTGDPAVDSWLGQSLWVLKKSAKNGKQVLTANLADGKGLVAEKSLILDPEAKFLLGFSASVSQDGRELPVKLVLGPSLSPPNFMKKSTYIIEPQGVVGLDDDIEAERAAAKEPQYEGYTGSVKFAGVEDNYFAMVYLPNNPVSSASLFQVPVTTTKASDVEGGEPQEYTFSAPWAEVPIDQDGGNLFLGPKKPEILHAVDPRLDPLAKLGFIQTPLLQLLRFIQGMVGNWGLAIVMLTLLVRLLFYPITYRNMVKMRLTQEKMKKVQPKVQRLKDRYKKLPSGMENRNKMNQEMMELYNKEGVNPMANMAGCLPMLLQIPIFWALFRMLPKAFELRGEPFILWIKDLSAQDPYFLTPILVGLTMFLSTKMSTGTSTENMQKYMLYVMPIMFLFFCMTAPMGLNVYWTTNNILSMIQQRFINKKAEQVKKDEAEKAEALRKAKKKKKNTNEPVTS